MIRTDLALEAKEMYHEKAGETTAIDGVVARSEEYDGISITTVEILNNKGAEALGKPIGKYITIEVPDFRKHGAVFYEVLSDELCVGRLSEIDVLLI